MIKQTLGVRQTTTNALALGESGQILPSVACMYNSLCFFNRLNHMSEHCIVKKVFNEVKTLHECGFKTWYGRAINLLEYYQIDLKSNQDIFKVVAKLVTENKFKSNWLNTIHSTPIARTYRCFKIRYQLEDYLLKVKNFRHRQSLAKFRTSTHCLHIETDRHQRNVPDVVDRKCEFCNVTEDEVHFLINCPLYCNERDKLYKDLGLNSQILSRNSPLDVFCLIMNMTDRCHVSSLAYFVHTCFQKRKSALELV